MLFFIFKNRKIIISYGKKINILNIIKSIFRFIHKYYIMSFIILFILSAVAFSLIYFGHSKKIENRFDNALKNYEETMKNIITNIVIINETNKYISTNSFQRNIDNTVNNKIVINNNSQNDTAEYLKMSFEVSFDILKNSITVIMKDSNDILQFWFAFLSVIMVIFTLIGFFVSSNILNQAREQLRMVENEAKNSIEKIKIEAKRETNKLIEENNKNIQEYNLFILGVQTYINKDYKISESYFNEVIKLNSNYSEAYNNRGIVKYNLGNINEAIEDYNKAIELNPNYAEAYNNRGIVKYNLGNINEAIEDYNKAIELNSNYSEAYYNRGLVKLELKENEEALNDFETAYNCANNDLKKDLINRIIVLDKQGYEAAKKFCEEHHINYKDNDNKE